MKVYSFRKLEIWQESIVFVKLMYALIESLLSEEKFRLINQLIISKDVSYISYNDYILAPHKIEKTTK